MKRRTGAYALLGRDLRNSQLLHENRHAQMRPESKNKIYVGRRVGEVGEGANKQFD